jgi:putative transposase
MRTSKFTPAQRVAICRQGESGVPALEVYRQHGISKQTYYRWKKQRDYVRADRATHSGDARSDHGITRGLLILKEPLDKILVGTKTWEILDPAPGCHHGSGGELQTADT